MNNKPTTPPLPFSLSPALIHVGEVEMSGRHIPIVGADAWDAVQYAVFGTWHTFVERVKTRDKGDCTTTIIVVHEQLRAVVGELDFAPWATLWMDQVVAIAIGHTYSDDSTSRLRTFHDTGRALCVDGEWGMILAGGVVARVGTGRGKYVVGVHQPNGQRLAIQIDFTHGSIAGVEDDQEVSDARSAARMAHAIKLGQQRADLEVGERVRVVEGSWCHLMRHPEDCFYCKSIGHENWHWTGMVEASKKSRPNAFSDPNLYKFRRDCGLVNVALRHCLAHEQ